jgi:hypothetical protein
MGKGYDALYGEEILDPLAQDIEPKVKEGEEPIRIADLLKSRAEGYFKRAEQFKEQKQTANHQAMMAVVTELTYVAKEIAAGNIAELEAKGR